MKKALSSGVAAGAAGTTVLNAVTYLDMALRGRPPSPVPEQVAEALLRRAGTDIPGSGEVRDARGTALGALGGILTGVTVGVAAAVVREGGVRPHPVVASAGTGLAAMAATDIPITVLGISDPKAWSAGDWMSDVLPHLAYGTTVQFVLARRERPAGRHERSPGESNRLPVAVALRCAAIGAATGLRSSLGLTKPGRPSAVGTSLVAGELIFDKLPMTPSRLGAAGFVPRLVTGAAGAGLVAKRADVAIAPAVALGTASAAGAALAGHTWRAWATSRMPPIAAAILEDVVAIGLTAASLRSGEVPARAG